MLLLIQYQVAQYVRYCHRFPGNWLAFYLEDQQTLQKLNGNNVSLCTSLVEIYMRGVAQNEREVYQMNKSMHKYRKSLIRLCRPVPLVEWYITSLKYR